MTLSKSPDTASTGMGASKLVGDITPDKTDLDDDIREALDDAVSDGEGRLNAYYVRHHLAKRGLRIVQTDAHDDLVSALEGLLDASLLTSKRDAAVIQRARENARAALAKAATP